jgi:hypothetical protein
VQLAIGIGQQADLGILVLGYRGDVLLGTSAVTHTVLRSAMS